ncbi:S8 family serine peptidase [Neolewinella antarctica]|uniref:Subtilisin family serine protease n=1 Tax=Neolewinella antarctica TaxID=442734 RepID=A0ABX0XG33_9BACT|nr:S8 family serine peptidase [Neolewinella antarctica]NJC27838.1 subtilisin family serine protease [Neolewinella antarctica]
MLPRLVFTKLLLALCLVTAYGQLINHRPGELIVELGADVDAEKWMKEQGRLGTAAALGRSTNIYLVRFDHDLYSQRLLAKRYWTDERVRLVQNNHNIAPRRAPNDPRYAELWQYLNVGQFDNGTPGADINVEPAWDVTTGGVTANGDTIVVAVLDDGTDLDHEDLVANLWRNHGEIPNNGVDDDRNGYVDDYYGYDTDDDDGDPEATSPHGTPVAGIIGAVGNNDLGVTGVNWQVKIMTIRNGLVNNEAEVLQAYGYALDARRLYDATDGEKGAYVVVTNASWGRNFGDVNDSPVWCSLYDQLGEAGILNVGAAANLNIDVDERGDLPTNCPSEYLIGVTNLDARGERVSNAAFGATSVDLGSAGQEVLTTGFGNNYRRFGGTSSATPHVAGAAALLYAAPCAAFGELLTADPAAAARYVRQVILSATRANPELAGKTVTGGQLDVGAAMNLLMSACDDCFAPTAFGVTPADDSATGLVVNVNLTERITSSTLRYRLTGATQFTTVANPSFPLTLPNLGVCTSYDFELFASCGEEVLPVQSLTASTDGCCTIPADFAVTSGKAQNFTATWTPTLAGGLYRIRFRKVGDEDWRTRSSRGSNVTIAGGIEACTAYEFEFRTECPGETTEYGARRTTTSKGCGACLEEEYCLPAGYTNLDEWIEGVNIAGIFDNQSGADPRAYGDFTGRESITLVRGGVYPLILTPGIVSARSTEEFRVYVDWDQDGQFASEEIIGEVTAADGASVTLNLTVPEDAPTVATRMRVIMHFLNVTGTACSVGRTGEYEDYCLDIQPASGCPAPELLEADYGDDGSTSLNWRASQSAGNDYLLRYRPAGSTNPFITKSVTGITAQVDDLNLCNAYEIEIASVCGDVPGEFRAFEFLDDCTDTVDRELADEDWNVFPNPATTWVRIEVAQPLQADQLRLFSSTGLTVMEQRTLGSFAELPLDNLPSGLYLLELRTADGRRGVRRLIIR